MLGWNSLFSFSSIFYRQQWWEKEKKVTIFLFLPGGLDRTLVPPQVAMAPPGSLGALGHFRFVPALEGGGFSHSYTPHLLG